jgi:hypothetical protein
MFKAALGQDVLLKIILTQRKYCFIFYSNIADFLR